MAHAAALPENYARSKLPTLRTRWRGEPGASVRRFGPLIFPGIPAVALMGLTASSMGLRDATVGGGQSAMGLYGVEQPALRTLAVAPETVDLLGRAVDLDRWATDVDGQTVTGLLNYRRHLRAALALLPAPLDPESSSSPYTLAVMAGSYSIGDAGCTSVLRAFESAIAALPDRTAWSRLGQLVARDTRERIGGLRRTGLWGASHLVLRVEQRIASGRLLAQSEHTDEAWFPASPEAAVMQALADAAHGAVSAPARLGGVEAFCLFGALAALAWRILR